MASDMKPKSVQADIDLKEIVSKWKPGSKPSGNIPLKTPLPDKPQTLVQGSLIMILHEVQNKLGYIPRETALELSRLMNIPLARIYEVLTFYNYFRLDPPGKHQISVCLGTACYLRGSPLVMAEVERILEIKEGQTTKDGLFYLNNVRCVGCCGLAPVMVIDGKIYGKVDKKQVAGILKPYLEAKE